MIVGYARLLGVDRNKECPISSLVIFYSHCYPFFSHPNAYQARLWFAFTFNRTILNFEQVRVLATLPYLYSLDERCLKLQALNSEFHGKDS